MTFRKRRKRHPPGRGGLGRKQKAPHTRQKTRTHARSAVADRNTSPVNLPSGAEADIASSREVALRVEPELGYKVETPVPTTGPQEGHRAGLWLRTGPGRLVTALLLPGLTFADMGRPAASLVCYALQASLVGWLPAVIWAVSARRHVAQKQKQLAARLR